MENTREIQVPPALPGDQVVFRFFDLSQLAELMTFQQLLFQPADPLQRVAFAHLVGNARPRAPRGARKPHSRGDIHADRQRRHAYRDVMDASLLGFQKWRALPAGAAPRWDGLGDPDGGVYAFSTLACIARSTHLAPDRALYVEPLPAQPGTPHPHGPAAADEGIEADCDIYLIYSAGSRRSYEMAEQRLYIDLHDFLHGVQVSPLASARFQERVYGAMRAYSDGRLQRLSA
ncbi:hypothetical protein [Bordetella genomosp. 13]|uniref:hypothetical protein n=1 Tax=Bordetella genomosp. 13 TaxID=463040 RepID=UPI0011A1F062|nr:hypothetical protein [Bordetella genomosp. 13]